MHPSFLNTKLLVETGNKMLELVAKKFEQMESFPVLPNVEPGFLRNQLPESPPFKAESLDTILRDTEEKIFPGLTQWSHPNFYAYYPSNITHASIIAEIFASAFGSPGFQWICSPAQTELENIVVDWIVQAFNLPHHFLMKNQGGGTIADTISDGVFISVHVAKRRKMKELQIELDSPLLGKFVGYFGECSHACATKGLLLKDIHHRKALPVVFDQVQQNYIIDVEKARIIIEQDIKNGLIPFWISITQGTTSTCAYDPIEEIVQICQQYKLWLNVDAAYAGSSWVIPEYRERIKGLEGVDSLEINFAKMMMCGVYGSLLFIKNKEELSNSMGNKSDFSFYQNKFSSDYDVWDYKDWQVALGKRFNSLKLWWMIRSQGIEGMRLQILEKAELAKYFAQLVEKSNRFKLFAKQEIGLITMYLKYDTLDKQNELNKKLYEAVNQNTKIGFISSSTVQGQVFLRVSIANHTTTIQHLDQLWEYINECADKLTK